MTRAEAAALNKTAPGVNDSG